MLVRRRRGRAHNTTRVPTTVGMSMFDINTKSAPTKPFKQLIERIGYERRCTVAICGCDCEGVKTETNGNGDTIYSVFITNVDVMDFNLSIGSNGGCNTSEKSGVMFFFIETDLTFFQGS
jgi:hypothetical protein